MYLQRLALLNFRVYEALQLDLGPGLSILVGPNAAGKSSLIEAVHLLATTKSPRTGSDAELVRWEQKVARADGLFCLHNQRPLRLTATLDRSTPGGLEKRLEIDGRAVGSAREVIGRVGVVMFGPDDLGMVKAAPDQRRRFLNTALGQLRPSYLDDLLRYRRALRQRNELLRSLRDGSADYGGVGPWTEQLVQAGAAVATTRRLFVADLARAAAQLHRCLIPTEELGVAYRGELSRAESEEQAAAIFRERLEDLADVEVRRGTTLAGPHRDDLEVTLDGISARQYGSQGQQRTAALSLKLGQAQVAREWSEEPPLLLLDDCLSELDQTRARALLDLGETLDGVIVTSAKLDPVLAERSGAAIYDVGAGQVVRRQ